IVGPAYSRNEQSCVRIAYLQAIRNNVLGNMSVEQTSENLKATLDSLDAAGVLPKDPRPVTTLAGARHRLGIDADQWIIEYAACPRCWKHYSPKELAALESPDCGTTGCAGKIYK